MAFELYITIKNFFKIKEKLKISWDKRIRIQIMNRIREVTAVGDRIQAAKNLRNSKGNIVKSISITASLVASKSKLKANNKKA